MKKTNAFTLTEFLIVIAIIGLLLMIIVPIYLDQQKLQKHIKAFTHLYSAEMYGGCKSEYAGSFSLRLSDCPSGLKPVLRDLKKVNPNATRFVISIDMDGAGSYEIVPIGVFLVNDSYFILESDSMFGAFSHKALKRE